MSIRTGWVRLKSARNASIGALAFFCSTNASALTPTSAIGDFSEDALKSCIVGDDLGKALNMSNPLSLIGSIAFTTTGPGGTTTLRRQPMALPTIVTEAGSPDQATCSLTLRAMADGGLNILGISAVAKKDELYAIQARLLTRQSLATVVEGGQNMPILESVGYRSRFRSFIQSRSATAKNFFLIDQISVYLIEVERYRKVGAGLTGVIAYLGGFGNYQRDESFKGARILVTGDMIPLELSMFPAGAPIATLVLAPAEAAAKLTSSDSQKLETSLASAGSE